MLLQSYLHLLDVYIYPIHWSSSIFTGMYDAHIAWMTEIYDYES